MVPKKKLVIVESPAKARTISQYLGNDYEVLASVGHIRDLVEPKNLPAELKTGSMGKFSVNIEEGFQPYYAVSEGKKKTVAELKRALKDADELYLATDEDREGEAIAWHLLEVLQPKVPTKRMVFHEITKDSIEKAIENTRDLFLNLVDAQETRRILDRLYGYEISPVLWRKVGPGLSAGRVQSAATRMVVDRERDRRAHNKAEYWDLTAQLIKVDSDGPEFKAQLTTFQGERLASGADFGDDGKLLAKAKDRVVLAGAEAEKLAAALNDPAATFTVSQITSKPYTRRPSAPFTTSTLQQEASRKLRYTTRQTMSIAQSLYENGYITYMRTDSNSLSNEALNAARTQASKLYGAESVSAKPRVYSAKSKNAQEAHEAIRPSGAAFRTPAELRGTLSITEHKLYELIWKRTVASQMADAKGSTTSVVVAAASADNSSKAEFSASGTIITFPGFMQAYEEGNDDEKADTKEARLPILAEADVLNASSVESLQHFTQPPARFTEASLVKTLEEKGIGRPSTYAAIISTILDRGYAVKRGQAFVPTWVAFSVVKLLENHFAELVEYDFTAEMEADLDRIARGEADRTGWLNDFYFGAAEQKGLKEVIDNLGEIDPREINSEPLREGVTLRVGRYGPYLEIDSGGETPNRISVPEELAPDELTEEEIQKLIEREEKGDRIIGVHPETGLSLVAKDGRFGPYILEELPPEPEEEVEEVVDPDAKPKRKKKVAAPKPRTASLFKTMSLDTVDLETAVQLLSLPRVVGDDPETGDPITAQNGRYGPYLKKGTDSRSLASEDQIFGITLDEAVEIYKQPKYGNRAASKAMREFDVDPVSEKLIVIKDGRFGPYITDGTTNVTVPKGEVIEELTFEQVVELLAIKRAKGPVKRGAKKAPVKKVAAKKPAAKKPAATKPAAKKPAATKPAATTAAKAAAAKKPATKTAAATKPAATKAAKAKAAAETSDS